MTPPGAQNVYRYSPFVFNKGITMAKKKKGKGKGC